MPSETQTPLDHKKQDALPRRTMLIRIAFAVLAGLVLLWFVLPERHPPVARRVRCASNMIQIGTAFLLYANENHSHFPPDLATALATQDLVPEVFVCPSGYSTKATTRFASDVAARAASNLDYIYVGEGLTSDVKADEPTLFERLADHNQEGGLVLFGDGRVEWIDKPQILKLLEPLRNTPRLTEEEYNAIVAK